MMNAFHLTHTELARVEPGSLVLIGPNIADSQHHFAIAVHWAGSPAAVRLVSFTADRSSLRPVTTELSPDEAPDHFVLNLGRDFTLEPNLSEMVRTNFRDKSALRAGDLLVHEAKQFLVVVPVTDTPALVVDLTAGEVTELSAESVAVFTHWRILVGDADGRRLCLVDTKSHRQAVAP